MDEKRDGFSEWAIVDLFGHQRIAGKVREQAVGGCSFVRVDVPETKAGKAFTRLLGDKAIYAITITDEETARMVAEYSRPEPMDVWTVRDMIGRKQLPAADTTEVNDRNVGYVSMLCECGGDAVTWHDGRAVCEVCKELAERKEDCETREDE